MSTTIVTEDPRPDEIDNDHSFTLTEIRFSAEETKLLRAEADRQGISVSDLVMRSLVKAGLLPRE